MRVSELAATAGVALSAVKFYQREGLLPPGERIAPNQVSYSAVHVQRLRLVRALVETGGLSVAKTKKVIAALDHPGSSLADTFGVAQHAMHLTRTGVTDRPSDPSRQRILDLCRERHWVVSEDNPGVDGAARALDGLRAVDFHAPDDYLTDYAGAAELAADADLRILLTLAGRDRAAEIMVVGTVLGDHLFAGLRRIAQQDATTEMFATQVQSPEDNDET